MNTTPTDIPGSGEPKTGTASAEISRNRVGWRDLAWITWRQHRLMLIGTGAVALLGAILMGLISVAVATRGSIEISVLMFDGLGKPARLLGTCVLGYSALVAVFWAAPLLSREYEQRTHLFAWSQDVSALRWLAGKTFVLGAAAVVLALLLGTVGNVMLQELNAATAGRDYPLISAFNMPFFEVAPLVQVGYALFGFALGLTVSALSRRTVLSMGVTFGIFVAVRMAVAGALRPYYFPPVRKTFPLGTSPRFWSLPEQALYVDGGYVNAAGQEIDYPLACTGPVSSRGAHQECLREQGVVGTFRDFQPIDRLEEFHLIEFGIFTVLALLLFLTTWRVMRRTTRL